MKKRASSLFLCLIMAFCMVCPSVSADSSETANGCEHDWIVPTDHYYSIPIPGEDLDVGVEVEQCSKCGLYKHTANYFFGKSTYYSLLPPHRNGMIPSELITYWGNVLYNTLGQNATASKYETDGGSAGTGGAGRRPSGYADDNGTPSISSSGAVNLVANHWYIRSNGQGYTSQMPVCIHSGTEKLDGPYFSSTFSCSDSISSVSSTSKGSYISGAYFYFKITFPCDGRFSIVPVTYSASSCRQIQLFNVDSSGSSSRYVDFSSGSNVTDTVTGGSTYYYRFGIECSLTSSFSATVHNLIFNFYPTSATVSKDTSITINQNVWNGNIYQDNSTNLTYIYPQYTTINDAGDTITNISENPIIYDSTTNEYYTYDSVTNNYYYITYVTETPTPTPSPDPTPTPDPGTDPTPPPRPSTPESGESGGSSGPSWWDKLLNKIGDAIVDGLLGAVSAVLKLIFKLFTTILGWIIWLASQVLTLFPFLPPGLGALLIGGVVVCFIIGLIKFIRG